MLVFGFNHQLLPWLKYSNTQLPRNLTVHFCSTTRCGTHHLSKDLCSEYSSETELTIMHAYCRRTLAPLLKQKQNIPNEVRLSQVQAEALIKPAGHASLNPHASSYTPPLVLPTVTLSTGGQNDDSNSVVGDADMTLEAGMLEDETRTRTRTVTLGPFSINVDTPPRQAQFSAIISRPSIRTTTHASTQVLPCPSGISTLREPSQYLAFQRTGNINSEDELLRDCERLATSVAEWLYSNKADGSSSDPYDEEILQLLSPNSTKDTSDIRTPTPASPRLVYLHSNVSN